MSGLDEPVREYVLSQPAAEEFLDRYEGLLASLTGGFVQRGQALPDHRHRLHGRSAPQRRDGRGARRPAARATTSTTMVVHRDLGRE